MAFKVNTITNLSGDSASDILSDITVGGNTVVGLQYTVDSDGGEPSSPNYGDVWYNIYDNTLYTYLGDEWRVVQFTEPETFQGDVSGYTSGGSYNSFEPGQYNIIDKFPFAADANATDVGDLTQARSIHTGQSSAVSGYNSGGYTPGRVNTIDKFPFATDGNATDVGDMTNPVRSAAGQSSSENGYRTGGTPMGNDPNKVDTIDKWPFAVDANATDIGSLTVARLSSGGNSE
jgi:hypothetical protein